MNQTPNKTDLSTAGPFSGLRQRFAQMTPQRRSFFASLSVLLVLLLGVSAYRVVKMKQIAGAPLGSTASSNLTLDPMTQAPTGTPGVPAAAMSSATAGTGATASTSEQLAAASAQLQPAPTALLMPIQGKLEQGYGWAFNPALNEFTKHVGVDYTAPTGTRVVAAAPGKVQGLANDPVYGPVLKIDVGGGMVLEYAGASYNVKAGDTVVAGQAIGVLNSGTPGEALRVPHLHFAVLSGKEHIDPTGLMTAQATDKPSAASNTTTPTSSQATAPQSQAAAPQNQAGTGQTPVTPAQDFGQ